MHTVIIKRSPEALVCDFCSDRKIYAAHECRDFTIESGLFGSTGDFAACKTCHELIVAEDWSHLLNRSVVTFFSENVPLLPRTNGVEKQIKDFCSKIHAAFRRFRTGKYRILIQ